MIITLTKKKKKMASYFENLTSKLYILNTHIKFRAN